MKKSPSHPGMYRKRPEKTGIPSSDMKKKKMGFCARTGRRSGRLLLKRDEHVIIAVTIAQRKPL